MKRLCVSLGSTTTYCLAVITGVGDVMQDALLCVGETSIAALARFSHDESTPVVVRTLAGNGEVAAELLQVIYCNSWERLGGLAASSVLNESRAHQSCLAPIFLVVRSLAWVTLVSLSCCSSFAEPNADDGRFEADCRAERELGNEPNLLQRYTVFSETFSNAASSSAVSNSRRLSSSFSVAISSCSIYRRCSGAINSPGTILGFSMMILYI